MKQLTRLTVALAAALVLAACGGQAPATGTGGTSTTGSTAATGGTPTMDMTSMPGMGGTSTTDSTSTSTDTPATSAPTADGAGSSTSVVTGTTTVTGTGILTGTAGAGGTSGTSVPAADTIGGVLASDPRISTLRGLVEAAGLEDTLSQTTASFTLFAPTDTAFAALPPDALRAVLADPAKIRTILTYHVVERKLSAADLGASTSLTTLQGEPLALGSGGGGVTINSNVKLVGAPIETGNGVIYIIDQVLVPPSVKLTQ